jgi:hypothetical protein
LKASRNASLIILLSSSNLTKRELKDQLAYRWAEEEEPESHEERIERISHGFGLYGFISSESHEERIERSRPSASLERTLAYAGISRREN